jgi:hypothetical protein
MTVKRLINYTVILLCLCACNTNTVNDEALSKAEKEMADNPDSALIILCPLSKCANTMPKSERMLFYLLYTEAKNKTYTPLTSDSAMLEAVAYYDAHGGDAERMKAHYLLGCVYRDMGEAPQALACLNDALDYFHPSGNSDYSMVSRIYAQKGDLFKQQQIHNKAVADFRKASHYAFLAKDTLSAINYYLQQTTYYAQMGKADSAAYISLHAYELYNKYGYPQFAPRTLAYAVSKYISDGNLKKGKKYLDIYLSDSTLYASDGMLKDDAVFSLYYLGEYYQKANRQDSAMYFYHELLHRSRNINDRKGAYEGLSEIFNARHQYDSAYIYSRRLVYAEDSSYHQSVCDHIQQIESAYNYQRSSDLANRQTERLNHVIIIVILLSFSVIVLVLLFYIIYGQSRRKNQLKISKLNTKYEITMVNYDKARSEYELLKLTSDKNSKKLVEKSDEIKAINEELSELRKLKKKLGISGNNLLEENPVIQLFRDAAYRRNEPTEMQWEKLEYVMEQEMPDFLSKVKDLGICRADDRRLCVLTKLGFKPNDMSFFFHKSPSGLSNWRVRLLHQMFNVTGSTYNFDDNVKSL